MPPYSRTGPDPIIKSDSVTTSEAFLRGLCENIFLSLWSYPNVFRDQRSNKTGDGKELCDMLVIFGNDILIFSDKYCKFPEGTDEQVAWNRWFKRTVAESARQVWGAERWIKEHPDRVFLDRSCAKKLPLKFPPISEMRFHLLVVAHGVSKRINEMDSSGSLMIDSDLAGLTSHTKPFSIGDLDPTRTFVHVLDDQTLVTLMRTLDTYTDFVNYLNKKVALIRNRPFKIFATGEEELLGVYLTHTNDAGEHDFVFPVKDSSPEPNAIFVGPGPWESFLKSAARKRQIEANGVSYLWDGLVEKICHHALTDTQYKKSEDGLAGTEQVARFMASEPRYERRALAMSWLDMFQKTSANERRIRVQLPSKNRRPTYIFVLFPPQSQSGMQEEEYREMRSGYLNAVCMVSRMRYPQITGVVAIATESGNETARSEDFGYVDYSDWDQDMEAEAKSLQKDLGILIKPEPIRVHISEYPTDTAPKVGRNEKCPCGSGKKYKKCCIGVAVKNW